jgi:acyl-coenzyme A synthetase/AMP-(fatty) acid ligase
VAFVAGSPLPAQQIRDELLSRLPAHMQPRRIVQRAELPLSDNGKIDRRALVELLESS